MGIAQRLWDVLRPAAAVVLDWIRRRPWLHKPVHAIAVRLAKRRLFSMMIKEVLEEQYLTAYEYQQWVAANDTLTEADREAIRADVARMTDPPTISVIMPVYNSDPRFLQEAIGSVRGQLYPHWELCIADDASPAPHVWAILTQAAAEDPRIKIVRRTANGHISAASNSALELATGPFVALMDHDDLLPAHALYEVAAELQAHPEADMLFSDEDKVDSEGRRSDPHFKPGWNPELLLGQNLVKHLCVIRRELIAAIGGFREGFEGSQDWDLALRISEVTDRVRHIPAILYHWRQESGLTSFSVEQAERCQAAAGRAVSEHLARTGAPGARVELLRKGASFLAVERPLPSPAPSVSVIVPTRDRAELLARCVDGVLNRTDYPDLELLVVDNDSAEPETHALLERLKADPRVRILPAPGPFNYSRINNAAVRQARGEILLLLNNDVAVTKPSWLKELVAQAARPDVGAAGALLYYEDGRVQHGGVVLGVGGDPPVAGHLYAGARSVTRSYYSHLRLARNVSAVTAACLAMRKAVFEEVGGFDEENLAVAFNDVDLCLRIRERGYQIVWTPRAALIHLESASRGSDTHGAKAQRFGREIAYMRDRWGAVLDNDPYYGPNFDPAHVDYRLATPPRRVRPWLRSAGYGTVTGSATAQ
ncbi:MAG: glycosyltransferase family 2 protein [Phenylobacterium sp.]|uniref:glycosyltransferase family 2 protein n=1 Tax=Phenylobacterium sp. TaxID=1871053 RepID=UPI0039189F10